MKIADTKLKRTFIVVVVSLITAVVVVILLISPITKYLVEKYSEKYSGRQIKMSWIYVNPFTGYIHISNLKIFESKKLSAFKNTDSIFFSAKGVSADFALLKLLSTTIEISEIILDQPKGTIMQSTRELNFSDLIKLFTPKKPSTTPAKFHFTILKISIKDGIFYYHDIVTPIDYFIKGVNIESAGKQWNADTIAAKFSFLSGPGSGSIKGHFSINFKNLDYRLSAIADKFDLNIFEQYLKVLVNYGSFRANLDADIKSKGNFRDQENLTLRGMVGINDFHFGKNPDDDYASFDKLVLQMQEVSPKDHKYLFDSVSLSHPYFKYERYDHLDNLETMFGKNGSNISAAYEENARFNLILKIADYIKVLVKNFLQSYYKVNRIAIYHGDIKYNDFAVSEKFSVSLNPLFIIADSIDKNHKRLVVALKSGIKPYGNVTVDLSINPGNAGDFDGRYRLQRVPVSVFNPYMITYTSFPMDRGSIEFTGTWHVRDGTIQSFNHLQIIGPRVGKRQKNANNSWIPSPFITFLIRQEGKVIDYEIPVTGSLKNPNFHIVHLALVTLGNLFGRSDTFSNRTQIKNLENEIEKSLTLKWDMRQCTFNRKQEKFVNNLAGFLKDNPDASIAVYPLTYAEKEMEHIQFYEAKKKYFVTSKNLNAAFISENDSLRIVQMSIKDSLFGRFLDKNTDHELVFTVQEKCSNLVGLANATTKFNLLNKEREDVFMLTFNKESLVSRVKMHRPENNIPFNGFSYYKIVYKGELPESLVKSYRKMNELNREATSEVSESGRKATEENIKSKMIK